MTSPAIRLTDAPEPSIPALELMVGEERWPLTARPLAIGRGMEADLLLTDVEVSRLHAWVVPAAAGPLLVDQSRHGTWVNGHRVTDPIILADGDEVRIGATALRVRRASPNRRSHSLRAMGRLRRWLRRYGPPEAVATVTAVGATLAVREATGSLVAGAYAGSLAEGVVFYGIMFLRESLQAAHAAGRRGQGFGQRDLLPVARGLMVEFGFAELLDALFVRPLCLGLGVRYVGGSLGALLGKLASDLAFYGPVFVIYEWRLKRSERPAAADPRRRTTARTRILDPD
ncbi:MAG: FHA domain-containing protein [Gemmatimonadetes bacterium]|nr:FHA domain-containing protein [Gemmatimonadota bacterium]